MRPLLLLFILIINDRTSVLCIKRHRSTQLYVVPFSSLMDNETDGSFKHPYLSLQQALDHIARNYQVHRTIIHLYPTYYFVDTTIHFKQEHSHTKLTTMNSFDATFYEQIYTQDEVHPRLSAAVISGGVPIIGWTQVSGNTYSAVVSNLTFVNQLFINDQRIVRTRVPTNFSDYLHYAAPLNDSSRSRYGFQYQPGQFNYKSLTDAMVVIYHSWTESHHYIDQLIAANNTILFTNPSDAPIGTYVVQGQRRFHIENVCEALVPNSFCFVNETKTVYLMTNGSYDPTKVQIITSVNEIVLSIASDDATKPIEDVIINNVAIKHGAWNIGRTERADAASAEFLSSTALFVNNATAIIMSDVEISHTGSYGLRIREETSNIIFENSLITDTGAGGMWIGDRTSTIPLISNQTKILSNEISYGGNVFPCGVGIIVYRVNHALIADNEIHHFRYNGMTIGGDLGYKPPMTTNILIQGNYVHDTGLHVLCDQGGIYTIGVQPGTVIHGNEVKNVYSYAALMWGIYLDEGSSNMIISNNVVYNTGWSSIFQHYGANNTVINNVFARASLNPPPQPGDWQPDGDVHVGEAENHISWTYTRNIVYDTFQGANHSAFSADGNVIAPFSNNVYYNPYGTTFFFGHQQLSFADWQKIGQDNNSVIADPLFTGDVNQCDFFTVRADSPAAKLGFVNITKPSKWTSGCDIDQKTAYTQFYHW